MLSIKLFGETIKNTFEFKGKSTRNEFWNFQFFIILTSFLISMALVFTPLTNHEIILSFFIILSSICNFSLGLRRCEDINKSRWLMLVALIPLIGVFFFYGYLGFTKTYSEEKPIPETSHSEKNIAELNFFKTEEKEINKS
jgi:uncharacterized membrane protein YhaH (DUF805 family)